MPKASCVRCKRRQGKFGCGEKEFPFPQEDPGEGGAEREGAVPHPQKILKFYSQNATFLCTFEQHLNL